MVDKGEFIPGNPGGRKYDGTGDVGVKGLAESQSQRRGGRYENKTIGWKPTCDCNAGEPVPCTVLDPFGGAGTTGLVAAKHRRNAILIELNPDYVEMARERLGAVQVEMF